MERKQRKKVLSCSEMEHTNHQQNRRGLGIGNSKQHNSSLLIKWIWRYGLKGQALSRSVISEKYGNEMQWVSGRVITSYGTSVQRTIRGLGPSFNEMSALKWRMEEQHSAKITDQDKPLSTFSRHSQQDATINEIWGQQGSNLNFRRLLYDWDIKRVANLLVPWSDSKALMMIKRTSLSG